MGLSGGPPMHGMPPPMPGPPHMHPLPPLPPPMVMRPVGMGVPHGPLPPLHRDPIEDLPRGLQIPQGVAIFVANVSSRALFCTVHR